MSKKARQMKKLHRQQLLRTGEVIGATVAECAVVCCCCPCGLINLLVLALYSLPAALCRRALRNKRRRRRRCKCGCDEVDFPMGSDDGLSDVIDWGKSEEEAVELEEEMWDMFYGTGTGFWRSSSMRDSNTPVHYPTLLFD